MIGPCLGNKGMTREREDCHGRAGGVVMFRLALAAARTRNDVYWRDVDNNGPRI